MDKKELKKLDDAWSHAVKVRDALTCQRCRKKGWVKYGPKKKKPVLTAHHCVVDRSVRATRWEIDNGITLCVKCHLFDIHKKATFEIMNDFLDLVVKKLGHFRIQQLIQKARVK